MRIVVLIKHVPDAAGELAFAADKTVDRVAADNQLSPLDEYAVEQALKVAETASGEIVYLTMGPAPASEALRKALAMGGDSAVHVLDDPLHGSDAIATSLVLARAIDRIASDGAVDLIVTGMASTDAGMSVVPAMISERLGLPALTLAAQLTVESGTATIRRDSDQASLTVTAELPALVSVTDQTGEARYPSFKGIMAAKKKPISVWGLADLGVSPEDVGLGAAWSHVSDASKRPPRQAGVRIVDEGDGGLQLAGFLAQGKFI